MPSPLTGVFQAAIETSTTPLVFGHTTDLPPVTFTLLGGFGAQVDAQTAKRAIVPGAAVGIDTSAPRQVDLGIEIWTPGNSAGALDWWVDLNEAFDAVTEGGVLRSLWLWLPGTKWGHREFRGRPRGTEDDDLRGVPDGLITMTCSFEITTGTFGTLIPDPPEEP